MSAGVSKRLQTWKRNSCIAVHVRDARPIRQPVEVAIQRRIETVQVVNQVGDHDHWEARKLGGMHAVRVIGREREQKVDGGSITSYHTPF